MDKKSKEKNLSKRKSKNESKMIDHKQCDK